MLLRASRLLEDHRPISSCQVPRKVAASPVFLTCSSVPAPSAGGLPLDTSSLTRRRRTRRGRDPRRHRGASLPAAIATYASSRMMRSSPRSWPRAPDQTSLRRILCGDTKPRKPHYSATATPGGTRPCRVHIWTKPPIHGFCRQAIPALPIAKILLPGRSNRRCHRTPG